MRKFVAAALFVLCTAVTTVQATDIYIDWTHEQPQGYAIYTDYRGIQWASSLWASQRMSTSDAMTQWHLAELLNAAGYNIANFQTSPFTGSSINCWLYGQFATSDVGNPTTPGFTITAAYGDSTTLPDQNIPWACGMQVGFSYWAGQVGDSQTHHWFQVGRVDPPQQLPAYLATWQDPSPGGYLYWLDHDTRQGRGIDYNGLGTTSRTMADRPWTTDYVSNPNAIGWDFFTCTYIVSPATVPGQTYILSDNGVNWGYRVTHNP